jgi:hypothetical protein
LAIAMEESGRSNGQVLVRGNLAQLRRRPDPAGHALPLLTTDDIMGYGFLPWFHWPPREPVLSRCGLRALDTVFAWRVEGTAPRRPTDAQIVC